MLSRNRKKCGIMWYYVVLCGNMWYYVVICGKICGLLVIKFFADTWPWMASFISWCCLDGCH